MKKFPIYLIVTIVCTLVATVLRVVSYINYFDGTFFTDANLISNICIIVCMCPLVAGIINRIKNKYTKCEFKSVNYRYIAVTELLGALVVGYSIYSVGQKYTDTKTIINSFDPIMGVSFEIPFLVVTILMFIYLIVCSILHFLNKETFLQKFPVFHVIPIAWSLAFVVYCYIHYSTSLLVIENFYALVSAGSLAFVLIFTQKYLSGFDTECKSYGKLMSVIGFAFCVNFSALFSSAILQILGTDTKIQLCLEISLVCFVLVIHIINCIFASKFERTRNKVQNKGGKRFKT